MRLMDKGEEDVVGGDVIVVEDGWLVVGEKDEGGRRVSKCVED